MNKFILLLAATAATFAANAEVLTPEQALARVKADGPSRIHGLNSAESNLRPVFTQNAGNLPAAYVFGSASGYMVVSADDVAAPLLGYADSGSFDPENIPDNLRYWLESYASEIAWARDNGVQPARSRASRADRASIAPLVSTQWNQSAPYNNYCPIYNGSRCVTGCVATAMAQVMKYYNYPAKGTGSHSYTTTTCKISESMDFSQTSFRWTSMADTYGSLSSTSQKNAVATLMHACGVSVDMDYTPQESGAPSMNVASALVNYFGYDKGVRYLMREYYGLAEWEDLVYNQLAEFGPVQYSGQNTSAGHSFVCDGYSTDGYFHFNWGWGGMSDGYFLLTALDPTSQGIGGSTAGYNFGQDIIANVATSGEGKMYEQMLLGGDFKIDTEQVQKDGYVVIVADAYNYSIAPISGYFGLKFTASDGSVTYAEAPTGMSNVNVLSGYGGWYVRMPSLSSGTYTVTPAWKSSTGEWFDIRGKVSSVKSYTATVNGNTTVFKADAAPQIYVSDIDVATPLYFNTNFRINATIENLSDSEYYGAIEAELLNSRNQVVAVADIYPVDILGGESQNMVYEARFSRYNSQLGVPAAGTYTLVFVKESTSSVVSDPVTVQLLETPSSTSVSVTSFSVEGAANAVPADNLQFNISLKCNEGYFANTLSVYIFPATGGSSLAYFTTPTLYVSAGESVSTKASGNFSQAAVGSKYMAAVYSGQTQLTDAITFTVGSMSGIADIDAADNAPVEYYTVDGMRVDSPGKGLYIVRQGSKASKVMF